MQTVCTSLHKSTLHKLAQEHFAQTNCLHKGTCSSCLCKLLCASTLHKQAVCASLHKWLEQAPLCKLFAQACTRALCTSLHKSTLHKQTVCTKALAQAVCTNCFVQALCTNKLFVQVCTSGLSKHLCANCLHKLAQEHFAQTNCLHKGTCSRCCTNFAQLASTLHKQTVCTKALAQAVCTNLHKLLCSAGWHGAVQCRQKNALQCGALQCSAVQKNALQCRVVQCSAKKFSAGAVQCSAVQKNAQQCRAVVQCSAVQKNAVQCSAVQCSAEKCTAVQWQCSAVQKNMLQCRAVQCSAVQCRKCTAAQGGAVQCSAVQCRKMHCSAGWCSAVQCSAENALQCRAVQCSAVQCSAEKCTAVQGSAGWCSAVQCSAVQCSPVQKNALQCRVVQCSAVQCRKMHCSNHTIESHARNPRSRTNFRFDTREHETAFPEDALPIALTRNLTTTGSPSQQNITRNTPECRTHPIQPRQVPTHRRHLSETIPDAMRTLLQEIPEWQQHCIDNLELCPNCCTKLRIAIENNNSVSASDGSAPHHGSFSWAIADRTTEEILATGRGVCQHFEGLTSHRMEAAGRSGRDIFLAATHSQRQHIRQSEHPEMMSHHCDNDECVERCNAPSRPHQIKCALHDCDLHAAIRELTHLNPSTVMEWIKGHQDDNADTPTSELPFKTRLNILTDQLAEQCSQDNPPFLPPPLTPQLCCNHAPITHRLDKFLRFHSTEFELRTGTLNKHPDWTDNTFDMISWKPIGRALKKLQPCRRTRAIKYQHKLTWTEKWEQDQDNSHDGCCPNCDR